MNCGSDVLILISTALVKVTTSTIEIHLGVVWRRTLVDGLIPFSMEDREDREFHPYKVGKGRYTR